MIGTTATDTGDDDVAAQSRATAARDRRLLTDLRGGSQAAFGALYDHYAGAVFAMAMRSTRDKWVAAEVTQETFLALWNRAELYDPERGSLQAWLVTIARNRAIDHIRSAGRHDRAATFSSFAVADSEDQSMAEWLTASGDLIATAAAEPDPADALTSKERQSAVRGALRSLTAMERRVIALAYDGGLSQSEIADELGWPLGTVKTRTRRALHRLREELARSPAIPGSSSRSATNAAIRGDRA